MYTPQEGGDNYVKVEFAGKEVPKSPYHVQVESPVDETKVQIKGLETRKFASTRIGKETSAASLAFSFLCCMLRRMLTKCCYFFFPF